MKTSKQYTILGICVGLILILCPLTMLGGQMNNSAHSLSDERVIIETRWGNIEIAFYNKVAPGTVENFLTLVKKEFYNGTTFHRVIPNFMIQGGDPLSKDNDRSNDGTGGPGYTIKAEFSDIKHVAGIVSMARSQHPDSAGSQFFICVTDCPWLDNQYTAFGKVVSGMDVVNKIVNLQRDSRDNPIDKAEMKKVYLKP